MKQTVMTGLLIGMLGSQSVAANNLNSSDLGWRILGTSHQLVQIANHHSSDICSGDVLIAAAYLESAGYELQYKREKALVSMAYGLYELKEITKARSYCAHLSPQVKPYLAKVILLKSELENSSPADLDQTSD